MAKLAAEIAMKVILEVPAGQDWATTHAQLLTMLAERWRFTQAPKELLRAPRFLVRAFYWFSLRMDTFECFVDLSSLGAAGTADRSVVEQFLEQVRATPDAVAVSGPDGDVSYAELERRALAIAERLRADGVGTESVLGVLAERSVYAVAGIWGVMLAGAAYLPMDAKYPDSRIRTLLGDARSPACLVQRPHDERDFLPGGCRPLVLDDLPAAPDSSFRPVDADQFGTVHDFHTLDGDSLSLITMVAEVAREVVGPAGERRSPVICRRSSRGPTVERISELAKEARGPR